MDTAYVRQFDLTEQVAVVTGAGSGIGRAIVHRLAGLGATVAVVDVDLPRAEAVAAEVQRKGGSARALLVDVSSRASVERMVDAVLQRLARIDVLANNAGVLTRQRVLETPEEVWDRTLEVNLKGTFLCSKAVAPHMVARRSGRIVNLGSSFSSRASVWNTSGGSGEYCASKAGVQAFTRSLAWELAPFGITVNAVAPGMVVTPMHSGYEDAIRERAKTIVPLGRAAEPEDIADVVAFLVSGAARYITGQTVHVNGGLLMID